VSGESHRTRNKNKQTNNKQTIMPLYCSPTNLPSNRVRNARTDHRLAGCAGLSVLLMTMSMKYILAPENALVGLLELVLGAL
jgi:hypothetical protein